jgi:hypothetical protein
MCPVGAQVGQCMYNLHSIDFHPVHIFVFSNHARLHYSIYTLLPQNVSKI